ncbi:hypothetical protein HD599_000102 [Conyzicola lurida]|uniref:Uncharacterized protein n=1 Tax=Conyzicola lurida TaxID=1172621 RepID=A0A841AK04_9MICO|nr:hypothetical protein [Conyzicola lurida]MBB5841779.1 hypothetical protein [Conyzicola lurida]
MTNAFEDTPVENVARGTVFSLLAIPVGIVAWVVLWRFGFVASIVGFGVAFLAIALYRFGAGVLGRQGAVRVAIVTIVTLLLAFAAGVVSDVLDFWTAQTGQDVFSSLVSPEFWTQLQQILSIPGVAGSYLPNFGLALLFGALGCFQLLRSAFRAAAAPAAPFVPPVAADPLSVSDAGGATPQPEAVAQPTPALPAPPVYPAPPTFPSPPDAVRPAAPPTPARPGEFEEFRDPNYKP